MMPHPLSEAELAELQQARQLLENPGLAARITHLIGMPVEKGIALLPDGVRNQVGTLTRSALLKATDAAILTMKDAPGESASTRWHKLGVAVSGGVGGFFGLAALAIELPLSTTLMLRSIADIARSQGESVSALDTRLACLEVFALGGRSTADDATESSYYAVRAALARSLAEASEYVVAKGLGDQGAPLLLRFIGTVAERFGVQVSEKLAAQAVPAIGAAGGALVNTLFIDHFQDMARGHFCVRRLERLHGKDVVARVYAELPRT